MPGLNLGGEVLFIFCGDACHVPSGALIGGNEMGLLNRFQVLNRYMRSQSKIKVCRGGGMSCS